MFCCFVIVNHNKNISCCNLTKIYNLRGICMGDFFVGESRPVVVPTLQTLCRLSIGSLNINQKRRKSQNSQVAKKTESKRKNPNNGSRQLSYLALDLRHNEADSLGDQLALLPGHGLTSFVSSPHLQQLFIALYYRQLSADIKMKNNNFSFVNPEVPNNLV